jgi:hypothetical protein
MRHAPEWLRDAAEESDAEEERERESMAKTSGRNQERLESAPQRPSVASQHMVPRVPAIKM